MKQSKGFQEESKSAEISIDLNDLEIDSLPLSELDLGDLDDPSEKVQQKVNQ